jgi:hypothetical protein
MVLEDITGKTLSAVDVFRLSMRALVEHLLNDLMKMLTNHQIQTLNDDVQWILTVPAIWTDTAKQFMRMSAEQVLNI